MNVTTLLKLSSSDFTVIASMYCKYVPFLSSLNRNFLGATILKTHMFWKSCDDLILKYARNLLIKGY